MKRLSCTVNKSVQKHMMYYSEALHCIAILMILWHREVSQYQNKNVNSAVQTTISFRKTFAISDIYNAV